MGIKELQYSNEDLNNRIKGVSNRIDQVMDAYSDRRFYIGDVDIQRKTLNSWKNFGLLPYKLDQSGWQKLSFIECCWLLTIKEFSQLGISLSKILIIKKELFPSESDKLIEVLKLGLEHADIDATAKDRLISTYNHPASKPLFKKFIDKNQYSFFTFFLQGAVNGKNIYLVYNKHNQLRVIFFDSIDNEMASKENMEAITQILQEAFVGINLKAIASEFFLKEKKRHSDLIFDFLSPVETKIIDLARGKDLKEITISFTKNEPATIYVTRNEPSEQVIRKVASYLKKGSFKKIEIRTRDGQLIHYNETDIMKLK